MEKNKNFDIKDCLDISLKKYNNHRHSATKYKPNEIFYSNSLELFNEVLDNIKKSFKYIGAEYQNFNIKEKCLLNGKFKIQKQFTDKSTGIILYDRIKHKKIYTKINVIITEIKIPNYKISIAKDYLDFDLKKNAEYYVNYKLLNKCSEEVWEKNLKNEKRSEEDIIDNNDYLSDNEEEFINNNLEELNN